MVRGMRVRGKWCGTLLLVAVLAGGAGACGPGVEPAPGGPASGVSVPPEPPAPSASSTAGTPDAPSAPGTPSTPGTPSGTASPTAPREEPQPGEVLVEVVVNGGLAGVRNRLVVHDDGSWTSQSGSKPPRTGRQTPAEVAELRAALEDPAYARVPARPTGSPVADGFQYFITYRHHLVVAGDGERPPALQRVFAALPEGGPPTSP